MNDTQLKELILQSLEHEMGGVLVYETAIQCAVNGDLQEEWTKYLEETRTHVAALQEVCDTFGIDAEENTSGRDIVKGIGAALVEAMNEAASAAEPQAAELVACEAVVAAETKDHLNWELLGKCATKLTGTRAKVLKAACARVEDEEDEHLYHTKGWCRELWMASLGMKAVLPPPEERHHVTTAIGAARAEQASARNR